MVEAKAVTGDLQTDSAKTKLEVDNLSIHYGQHCALSDVSLDIRENEIFGIKIGRAHV